MKFGKALETNAEAMPEEWRPYVIHYKALKKKINAIVKELDDSGLPSPIIKSLLSQSMTGDMQRLEYSFDEDKEHLKTCIKVVIDDTELGTADVPGAFGPFPLSQEEHLSKLFAHELAFLNNSASSSSSDLQEQLLTEEGDLVHGNSSLEDLLDDADISEASENTSLSGDDSIDDMDSGLDKNTSAAVAADGPSEGAATLLLRPTDDQPPKGHTTSLLPATAHGPTSGTTTSATVTAKTHAPSPLSNPPLRLQDLDDEHASQSSSPSTSPPPQLSSVSSSSSLDETMDTIVTPGVKHDLQVAAEEAGDSDNAASSSNNTRIHTTEEDGKRVLVIELTADTAFFDQLGDEVSQLSKLQQANKHEFESKVEDLRRILTVVASPQNKDMYTWREILKLYLDAQVFVGDQETDRSTRSSEKAQTQLHWFLTEMERSKLVGKFKLSKSKVAFNQFFQLNSELIIMKQFKELNQMAMTKILKKHDKRTNLTASSGFPKHLQNEPFYNDNISKSLTYTIGNQLVSIIPQPDDYACPICMSVAWKPIRLNCSHVFCVRCLIKAQRKKMIHCPICRQTNSVVEADASNLDVAMMNFLKLYFPKEIKEKRKESSREQAAEEMEAFTGQRWSEVPESACAIM
ncbi:hypothetical protein BGZ70_008487 [Mortierella alpina]|uniref:SPX domain-containing protein n=1 Tax=Mortierella alpina TaxID=64518 RepID=A0A9P6J3E4_MORAP|nr:hypothetical protein BGZ70_008487 [Mortierella alpina]